MPNIIHHQHILQPYQIFCLDDLENEVWKEIPDYDGYYQISNLGRIKSLERTIETKNGKFRHYKSRILKPVKIRYKNNTIGEDIVELKVGIFYYGHCQNIRIGRTVYNLFVRDTNYKAENLQITHKDGNRFNNCANNLILQTISQKQKIVFNSNRGPKIFQHQTKESKIKAAKARQKKVTKFTLQGYPIKVYNSVIEASIENGLSSSSIICAIKCRKMVSSGGYLWKYGRISSKIDNSYYINFLKKSKQKKATPIIQLNQNLQQLNTFKSITEASKKTGIHTSYIINSLKNQILSKNFYWKYM